MHDGDQLVGNGISLVSRFWSGMNGDERIGPPGTILWMTRIARYPAWFFCTVLRLSTTMGSHTSFMETIRRMSRSYQNTVQSFFWGGAFYASALKGTWHKHGVLGRSGFKLADMRLMGKGSWVDQDFYQQGNGKKTTVCRHRSTILLNDKVTQTKDSEKVFTLDYGRTRARVIGDGFTGFRNVWQLILPPDC